MKKNKIWLILIVLLFVLLAILVFSMNKVNSPVSVNEDVMNQENVSELNNTDETSFDLEQSENVSNQNNESRIEINQVESRKGSYESFSREKLALADKGSVVLFFHASWCPSCRALNSDIEKNMNSIPEGVTILKTDYDKETDLKRQYGITNQHTLVQVDRDGNMIKKWSGGSSLSGLLSQIQ